MEYIQLDNGKNISLKNKSILILKSDSKSNNIINNEDDYDIIVITGGSNRTVNIKLHQPATIVVENGNNNTVNIAGGMALPISQAVLIKGHNNCVNGLKNLNTGKLVTQHCHNFSFELFALFDKIEIE